MGYASFGPCSIENYFFITFQFAAAVIAVVGHTHVWVSPNTQ